jgi:uncharacterized protein with GYD domain
MPFFMYQASYTADSWAAQMKNPENRLQIVGKQACEAVGGRLVAGWYCFGEYDIMVICDVPNAQAMAAIAIALGAGGALKSGKTTVLMGGAQAVEAIKQAGDVAKVYRPAGSPPPTGKGRRHNGRSPQSVTTVVDAPNRPS